MNEEKELPQFKAPVLLQPVFPSSKPSISVLVNENSREHKYIVAECAGFVDGETIYSGTFRTLDFLRADGEGGFIPGFQNEQLLIVLIDRCKKLNAEFPSREGALAITKMEEALFWMEARVKERVARGVMGKLEK